MCCNAAKVCCEMELAFLASSDSTTHSVNGAYAVSKCLWEVHANYKAQYNRKYPLYILQTTKARED